MFSEDGLRQGAADMLDFAAAREMAQAFIDENMCHEDDRYVILDEKVCESWDAWHFPYQSEQFLKTGIRTLLHVPEGVNVRVWKGGRKKKLK